MTTHTRKIGATLLGSVLAVALALPVQAQETAPQQTTATIEHVQLGRLVSVDQNLDQLVLVPRTGTHAWRLSSTPSNRVYRMDPITPVHGLGEVMRAEAITPDQEGDLVRVTYSIEDGHPTARRIDFLGALEIRVTAGTISNVNTHERTFDITNSEGRVQHMTMDDGNGGAIDSPSGLMSLSQLHDGQLAEVYFAPRAGRAQDSGVAYLVVRTNRPLPLTATERTAG